MATSKRCDLPGVTRAVDRERVLATGVLEGRVHPQKSLHKGMACIAAGVALMKLELFRVTGTVTWFKGNADHNILTVLET